MMTATRADAVRHAGLLVVVLGLLTTLGPLSIDLYLPAFPTLQQEFGADDGVRPGRSTPP
jgi:DHA1 family bicyclomycin/chloramphenicol resistance-like MFS transporter